MSISQKYHNIWELVKWIFTKQDLLVSGVNIKTINGNTLLGSGDLVIGGNTTTLLTTATTDTTIVDVLITGTVVGILGDGGQTWVTGFTSVGNTVTLIDGTSFAISQPYLIFIQ